MFGLGFVELLILAIFIIPLILLIIGILLLSIYIIYLLIGDRFFNSFHLRHRKAH